MFLKKGEGDDWDRSGMGNGFGKNETPLGWFFIFSKGFRKNETLLGWFLIFPRGLGKMRRYLGGFSFFQGV